jgi:histidyl-tRNA synthetase
MRAFDADDRRTRETMRNAPILLDRLAPEDAEHFERVKELLDDAGITYELDPTLVRGLDYYARTLWEFTSDALGAQSAVGGGGRYDGLIEQLGGAPTPGVGWAAGVERMLLAAGEQPVAPDVVDLFVALPKPSGGDDTAVHRAAFLLANSARRAGLGAQMELAGRGLKGQLKHADRLGARYVAIIDDPMQITLKDMEAGDQIELGPAAVIPAILRGSRLT